MAESYLKLYRVKSINVYPYEDVQSVSLVAAADRLSLTTDLGHETTYRCYGRHPDRYITIAPIETQDDAWEGASGPEVSPFELLPGQPLACQIEYVLFDSWRVADHERLGGIVDRIKSGTLDLGGLPARLRPARCITTGDDQSYPWDTLRSEGKRPPDRATSAFYVRERSDVPWINDHTIPDGIDYDAVRAEVVTYDLYPVPPRLGELMRRLDAYCDWFAGVVAGHPGPRPKSARRKAAKRS